MKNLIAIALTTFAAIASTAADYAPPANYAELVAMLEKTVSGRETLHGKPGVEKVRTVDTNALTRTTVTTYAYPDGYVFATTSVTPFRVKAPTDTAKRDAEQLPERLRQLREEREANARTNWVYSITGRVQRAPRRFSVMRVTYALQQAGYWPQVEAYMTQAGLLPLYYTANDFREDDPIFIQGVTVLQTQLGLTSDQIEAILSQSLYRE